MKTMASPILDVLAGLLPINLAIDKWRHNAAITLATVPESHPIHSLMKQAACRYVQSHPSPMHEVSYTYGLTPKAMEKINPIRHPNSWSPGIMTVIPEDKDEAVQGCAEERVEVRIFTDGSLTEKGVGAVAVIYRKKESLLTIQAQLGDACDHMVYEAECAAMALGIFAIKKRAAKTVTIHVDNQAVIRAAADQKQGSGKYILDAFHAQIEALRKRNSSIKLKIRWSPGHVRIKGNKEADAAAKVAMEGVVSPKNEVPPLFRKPLPHSKSAAKQHFNARLKEVVVEAWYKAPQATRLDGIITSTTVKNYQRVLAKVDRVTGSLWTQLKMGHVRLNKHLKRINISQTDKCPACWRFTELVDHVLWHCHAYNEPHAEMHRKVNHSIRSIKGLLGNEKNIGPVAAFIRKTGRLTWTLR